MEFNTDQCRVCFDEASNTLSFSGRLRSVDAEVFTRLDEFLHKASQISKLSMIWDVRALQDLNSAGLGVLYRFVSSKRDNSDYALRIKANSKVYWQDRSLPNLKKMMPRMQLEFFQV